jgi:hypothetical protein
MSDHPTTRLLSALVIAGWMATGCSFVLDKNANQCTIDSDCDHFGSHPSCQAGVCVSSGLGPADCFFGTPTTQEQFANQCTTASTYQFDNCARLGLCDDASLTTAFSTSLTPTQGTIPPPLVTQLKPSTLCSSVAPNVVYVTGSTNLPPLLKAVQPLLYANNPPYAAIFAPQTSCKGAGSMYDGDPLKRMIKDVPNNYAFYYDMNGTEQLCLLDPNGNPVAVDVGESDVYPLSCGYSPAAGVADYAGPIQAIVFAVPAGSSQTSISAEAAHLVFAAGGDNGKATPWIDQQSYFVRSSGTGTTQLPSRAIGLDPSAWWGIDRLSASNLVASMETLDPKLAEGGIGILSSDFADKNRANLRELAFQQRGQRYGYLADSTPESLDKANVRDGHYPIWGAIHFMAATTNGVPSDAAKALISQFNVPKLDENLVSAIIDAGFVPTCAMKVTHSTEVGPLTAYNPSFRCGCFFDKKANGTTTCQVCTGNSDCPSTAPDCNYGYCEKQ